MSTPALGYCTFCLDLLWREIAMPYAPRRARIRSVPGGDTREEMDEVRSVAHAVDAFERGNRIEVTSMVLRMRADVVIDEPRCVDHYRLTRPSTRR